MSEENKINIQENENRPLNNEELEYKKEVQNLLEKIENIRKEEGMDDQNRSEYLENITKKAKQFSPERINKIIDEALDSAQFDSYIEKEKARKELYEKIAFDEALFEDINEAQKEYEEGVKEEIKKIDEVFSNMNYSNLLDSLSEKISSSNKDIIPYKQMIAYQKIYQEVHNIIYLDKIKEKLYKLNKPYKYIEDCDNGKLFEIHFAKFISNLQKSKNMFKNPIKCVEAINSFLPEDKQYGKYFTYCLVRYINERGVYGVDSNTVFLEGLFNIIFNFEKTNKINEIHKQEFINNILECVDICLKGKTNN